MEAINRRGRDLAEISGIPMQPTADQIEEQRRSQAAAIALRRRMLWFDYKRIAERGELLYRAFSGRPPQAHVDELNVRVNELQREAVSTGGVPPWMVFPAPPGWRAMEPAIV